MAKELAITFVYVENDRMNVLSLQNALWADFYHIAL